MTADPAALRPPKQWEHLPEHLLHHKNGALVRCFWHEITAWSFYPGGLPVDSDVMAERGWIYLQPHGPCTLDAIVPDPEDEAMVAMLAHALACAPFDGDYDAVPPDEVFRRVRYAHLKFMYERQAKAVLTALRDAAKAALDE